MFNQLTNSTMSKREMIALRAMQAWTVCLGGIVLFGIVFAIVSMITGNYTGTACREF